jgi:hypothetical protein
MPPSPAQPQEGRSDNRAAPLIRQQASAGHTRQPCQSWPARSAYLSRRQLSRVGFAVEAPAK